VSGIKTQVDFFDSYVKTYIERDVRDIVNVTDLSKFRKFMSIIANRTGQLINYLDISNMLDISNNTIKN
jgi:predicted AAA+ superfamily ATPase